MNSLRIYIVVLVFFNLLATASAFLVSEMTSLVIPPADTAILSAAFSAICLLMVYIFLRGQARDPQSQTLHTLVAVSLKFLTDLILALIWITGFKKTSSTSLLLFFVLYLALTIFSVVYILKILKSKPLNPD